MLKSCDKWQLMMTGISYHQWVLIVINDRWLSSMSVHQWWQIRMTNDDWLWLLMMTDDDYWVFENPKELEKSQIFSWKLSKFS